MRHSRIAATTTIGAAAGLAVFALAAPATADSHHRAHQRVPVLTGTVGTVGTGSFDLLQHDGNSAIIDTNSSTRYSESGDSVAPSGVTQGEQVAVTLFGRGPAGAAGGSVTPSGKTTNLPVARSVHILLASASGQVSSLLSGGFVLSGPHGTTQDVFTSGETEYFEPGQSPTGVTLGELVVAFGNEDAAAGGLDALFVHILPPPPSTPTTSAGGIPSAVGFAPNGDPTAAAAWTYLTAAPTSTDVPPLPATAGDQAVAGVVLTVTSAPDGSGSIAVLAPGGTTATVIVSQATEYYVCTPGSSGPRPGSLSDVSPGDRLIAFGAGDDGTFTASDVYVTPKRAQPVSGAGGGWQGPNPQGGTHVPGAGSPQGAGQSGSPQAGPGLATPTQAGPGQSGSPQAGPGQGGRGSGPSQATTGPQQTNSDEPAPSGHGGGGQFQGAGSGGRGAGAQTATGQGQGAGPSGQGGGPGAGQSR